MLNFVDQTVARRKEKCRETQSNREKKWYPVRKKIYFLDFL